MGCLCHNERNKSLWLTCLGFTVPSRSCIEHTGTLEDLRIDYCGFGPFCSTRTKLLLSISLLKVLICIICQLKDKY